MALSVGTHAPDFELPLNPGEAPLRLSDYHGQKSVVLLFFPLAFSGVCTEEMCEMARSYGEWSGLDAEVIGVSVDSPFVNRKFAEQCGAEFPIVSDFNREAVTAYDVKCADYFGLKDVAYRSAFVIDPEGRIVYAWMTEDASQLPDLDEIREALRGVRAA